MSHYRRSNAKGASYFFTVVTLQRKPVFNNEVAVGMLRQALRFEKQRRPFEIEAIVVLPDHLHTLWRLPEGDADFSSRWREVKKYVSNQLSDSKNERGESNIWQRRFWEHQIKDEHDWRLHMDYIHFNPVKHAYVSAPVEWCWSSFRSWVEKGAYGSDWGSDEPGNISGLNFE